VYSNLFKPLISKINPEIIICELNVFLEGVVLKIGKKNTGITGALAFMLAHTHGLLYRAGPAGDPSQSQDHNWSVS
jgi:hypothetical protein